MALDRRTYRIVDGEQIEGTWRPVFIRNGRNQFLTDLLIYADGLIYCWDWVDLDGLRAKLASGKVTTTPEPGIPVSAHHLASWTVTDPAGYVTAEDLVGEVADEIDTLNGRPDATRRCLRALAVFLADRTEGNRELLAAAYRAIPSHLRVYALGDMDYRDWPLEVLCTPVADLVDDADADADEKITFAEYAEAVAYFSGWVPPASAADRVSGPTVKLATIPGRFPSPPGVECLRNECPAPIELGGITYPTALHAYWALAVTTDTDRLAVRDAPHYSDASVVAQQLGVRDDWPAVRLAAMHTVVRAKFQQHPDLAAVLAGTGDGRIEYNVSSPYWSGGKEGRNWMGRLLELVRSEMAGL
ncbi:hypothetical protein ACTI_62030 [Actinoplanes sp. OR16]|uniref:NADAR family protein n=1 Tax=Actinoplanes sp. OR16 TaxID=946334 RepID=UPI000F6F0C02|nr:NADAR family protein [Actinoplanes sp. OR16]BBH69518.1 hypothetical protein ACTI_62030 [Actinoplanes sp. OR16]